MPTKDSPDFYVVLESFIARVGDEDVFYRAGEAISPKDPALRKWPDKFGPISYPHQQAEPRIEQATAAPGEKRGA